MEAEAALTVVSLQAAEEGLPQADPNTLCAAGSLTPRVPPSLLDGFPGVVPPAPPSPHQGGRGPRGRAVTELFLSRALGELARWLSRGGPRGGGSRKNFLFLVPWVLSERRRGTGTRMGHGESISQSVEERLL